MTSNHWLLEINLKVENINTIKVKSTNFNKSIFCCTGILDQGAGVLVVFEETESDKTYETALDTIQDMGKVVDALYNKAKKLS
jgi:hypothetical protein